MRKANSLSDEFILDSCKIGDKDVINAITLVGCDLNIRDQHSKTPLFLITYYSHNKALQKILKSPNLDLNLADNEGCTPTFIASYKNNYKAIKMLLEAGADPNIATNDGQTPLSIACAKGNIASVEMLLKSEKLNFNFNNDHHPLFLATQNGFNKILKILLDKKIFDINSTDENGFTPLALATQYGHQSVIKLLIEKGANIDKPNNFLKTPLDIAEFKQDNDIKQIFSDAIARRSR